MKNKILLIAIFAISSIAYSQNLSSLFEKVNSSTVVIKTISKGTVGYGDRQNIATSEGLGSGVLISKDGKIWTASHVVHTAESVIVKFTDGDVYEAEVISTSPMADVALLQIGPNFKLKKKHVAKIGDSDKIKIGEDIFVIGSPLGVEHTLSKGIVSGKMKKEGLNNFQSIEFIQTDAAINPGNSGGPMFNMNGEVIGIASFIVSQTGGFNGIGFGVSSNVAETILMEQSSLWTGMEFLFLEGEIAELFNLPQVAGLLIQTVTKKGLGNDLGLRGGNVKATIEGESLLVGGDIILELAGISLVSTDEVSALREKITETKTGDTITIKYLRAGILYTKEIVMK